MIVAPHPTTALERICRLSAQNASQLPFPFVKYTLPDTLIVSPTGLGSLEVVYRFDNGKIKIVSERSFHISSPKLAAKGIKNIYFSFERGADLPQDYTPEKGEAFLSTEVPYYLHSYISVYLTDDASKKHGKNYIPYFSLAGELTPMWNLPSPVFTYIGSINWKNAALSQVLIKSLVGQKSIRNYFNKTSLKYEPAPSVRTSIVLYNTATEKKLEIGLTGLLADYIYADSIIDLIGTWRAGTMMADAQVNGKCQDNSPSKKK